MHDWLDFLPDNKKSILLDIEIIRLFHENEMTLKVFLENLDWLGPKLVNEQVLNQAEVELLRQKSISRKNKTIISVRESPISTWTKSWIQFGRKSNRKWIHSKEIKIFRMPGVKGKEGKAVMEGLKSLIEELELDFKVSDCSNLTLLQRVKIRLSKKYRSSYSLVLQKVRQATMPSGVLNARRLDHLLFVDNPINEAGKFGVVIIVNQIFEIGRQNAPDWGFTDFDNGICVISTLRTEGNLNAINIISKHEAAHLFGFRKHHNDDKIQGYKETKDCVMEWGIPTGRICEKCFDALKSIWVGIEERTGKKFFKN